MFIIRNIEQVFASTKELFLVAVIISFSFGFEIFSLIYLSDTTFVVLGWFLYVPVVASLCCLWLTSVDPILKTYETSTIIPFSLNQECLNNFESAIIQETSSRYFYDFLCYDLKDRRGITLFALYVDLRRFMILCDDKHRLQTGQALLDRTELVELAKGIIEDFVMPGGEFSLPTNEIIMQLRAQYDSGSRTFKNETSVNEVLF